MRAARFHGIGLPVVVEDVDAPVPGPGEVVVDVAACGICGSDVHFLEDLPIPAALPVTLGHEPAGIVAGLGEGVEGWAVGDRIAIALGAGCGTCRVCIAGHPMSCPDAVGVGLHSDGAFAEQVLVPARALVAVPDGVTMAAAAIATDCVATPYHAIVCRAELQAGERVAVIGAGGLGIQAITFARHFQAETVIALDTSPDALERAAAAGATATALVGGATGADPTAAIRGALGGDGADLVVECVGRPELVSAGILALRPGGRIVVVGMTMQPPPVPLPTALFSLWELSILGCYGSHCEDVAAVLRLEAEGAIDIESSISHRIGLDGVPDGLEMLRGHRGSPQRIVMERAGTT